MNQLQLASAHDFHQRIASIGQTVFRLFGLALVGLATIPITSYADTVAQGFPFGGQVQITVYKGTLGQGDDRDARLLMDAMNVPLQNSPLGPGKAIVDSSKLLNWTCADRGQAGYHCALLVRPGQSGSDLQSRTQISPPGVTYMASGEVALALFEMLVPTAPGAFAFENQEQTLKISATPEKFELVYRE
jgi:hypothetical protein